MLHAATETGADVLEKKLSLGHEDGSLSLFYCASQFLESCRANFKGYIAHRARGPKTGKGGPSTQSQPHSATHLLKICCSRIVTPKPPRSSDSKVNPKPFGYTSVSRSPMEHENLSCCIACLSPCGFATVLASKKSPAAQKQYTAIFRQSTSRPGDGNNFGPSMIKAFGEFTGGELSVWPEDDKSGSLKTLPEKKKITLDISKNLALFNGNTAHEVADFEGSRYSVVYFTAGCHAKMPDDVRQQLKDLDFMLPKKAEKRYSVLRAPTGYFSKVSKPKGPAVMTWRVK